MTMVAEGVQTAEPVVALAARRGVEMPVADQVVAVLRGERPVGEAVQLLMRRPAKSELVGITPSAELNDGRRPR
jgi:glycerol-3-phosphate dehydrogenase (NAD(P)+)